MPLVNFPPTLLPPHLIELRNEVREFVHQELSDKTFQVTIDGWLSGYSPEFSKKLGRKGWLGMTLPKEVGGQGRSPLDRFVVIEELLAAGAPVSAHWVADRQTAPLLAILGSDAQKEKYLPGVIRGETYFAIGLSEPNAGSDLAALTTKAVKVDGGWLLNGRKIWSSGAHFCHAMVVLCRTSPLDTQNRHAGMSQLIIDLDQPGIDIRPIHLISGEHHFNEVSFEDVFVADDMVVGKIDQGWQQAMGELAYERSGPERFLSTLPLFTEMVRLVHQRPNPIALQAIGRLSARLLSLHQLSLRVTGALSRGESADTEAVLVKDVGTRFEKEIAETARLIFNAEDFDTDASTLNPYQDSAYSDFYQQATLQAPGFTLRGGTNEILRGIVARGLGLR
ncbi:MAG: acyl-CoA dehydrogenase [Gammaproteobacteria bacterium]|nr:MAG: acyl-CoA dehydrogenase [Gammaproteobacteria bacterium]